MRLAISFLAWILTTQVCSAWSEGGHRLIAVMAFSRLIPEQQHKLIEILKSHPRFDEDFKVPELIQDDADTAQWLIGRAGFWPDVARSGPYDRPNWHWQLGATYIINVESDDYHYAPLDPGPCPADATLDSKELHILQAIDLCRRIWRNKTQPNPDRALAVCWLAHLIGDIHQPCNAGSLYAEFVFPEGDRGAHSIPTKQSENLHAVWDGLLGARYNSGDIRRRQKQIEDDMEIQQTIRKHIDDAEWLDPQHWLDESRKQAVLNVYDDEIKVPLDAAQRSPDHKLPVIELSTEYLKTAGRCAQKRAAFAAWRLAQIFAEGIE